jgi:uncharacterized membrane protein YphA (DoxX/SURF4 family)
MMEYIGQYHEASAAFIARVILGFLFFFQGYDAIFNIGMSGVIQAYKGSFSNKNISAGIISIASWFTSLTEFICGTLLVLGLMQYTALYLLGLNLIIATLGFGMNTPMWDPKYVLPRLLLLIFLLCIPPTWDIFSLDHFLFKP